MQRIKRNLNAALGNGDLERRRHGTWCFCVLRVKKKITKPPAHVVTYPAQFSSVARRDALHFRIMQVVVGAVFAGAPRVCPPSEVLRSTQFECRGARWRAGDAFDAICRSRRLRNRCRAARKVNAAFRGRVESCRRSRSTADGDATFPHRLFLNDCRYPTCIYAEITTIV